MKQPDELAAAKARLIQLAGEFDPLGPVRKHPLAAMAVAGVGGAAVGANKEALAESAALARSLTVVVQSVISVVEHIIALLPKRTKTANRPPGGPSPESDTTISRTMERQDAKTPR